MTRTEYIHPCIGRAALPAIASLLLASYLAVVAGNYLVLGKRTWMVYPLPKSSKQADKNHVSPPYSEGNKINMHHRYATNASTPEFEAVVHLPKRVDQKGDNVPYTNKPARQTYFHPFWTVDSSVLQSPNEVIGNQ